VCCRLQYVSTTGADFRELVRTDAESKSSGSCWPRVPC